MPTIWILRHTPEESPGLLAPALTEVGLAIELIEMWRAPLPEFSPDALAGLVVLGGAMNADDVERYPFLAVEVEWLRQAVAAELPVLGICLGSQLLAKALGGRVTPHVVKEIGWYDVAWDAAALDDPLLGALAASAAECPARATTFFQWHGDTFSLPPECTPLARTTTCAQQAFARGRRAWGLQFHPEVDAAIVERWLDEPAGREELAGLEYIDAAEIRRRLPAELARTHVWSRTLFRRFGEICLEAARG